MEGKIYLDILETLDFSNPLVVKFYQFHLVWDAEKLLH